MRKFTMCCSVTPIVGEICQYGSRIPNVYRIPWYVEKAVIVVNIIIGEVLRSSGEYSFRSIWKETKTIRLLNAYWRYVTCKTINRVMVAREVVPVIHRIIKSINIWYLNISMLTINVTETALSPSCGRGLRWSHKTSHSRRMATRTNGNIYLEWNESVTCSWDGEKHERVTSLL